MRGRVVVVRQDGEASTLTGHRDRVTSVAFSPLGTFLATTSVDHVARIWSLSTNEVVRALQHNTAVRDADFSPDGRWLVTATLRASLWDADCRRRTSFCCRVTTDPSLRWPSTRPGERS